MDDDDALMVPGARVLICDDEPLNRQLLRATVGDDYQVTEAHDGLHALRLFAQQRFDAVILDIIMPTIDGFEVCRRIRHEFMDDLTPIIMLTSLDDPHKVERALDLGANDFVTKPFNRIELRARIRAGIEHRLAKEQLREARNKLEQRVQERTGELVRSNQVLEQEIAIRQQKERELVEFQEQLADLVVEKTRDLVDARDNALAAERAMSSFLANMSHELRTPLHSILSFARFGIKKVGKVEADQIVDYFQEITGSADNLLALVNQLLDLSKLKAGRMQYNFQSANLLSVVRSVRHEFSALQEEQNILIDVYCETDHLAAVIDRDKIAQVVRNLLSNAMKFSPADSTIEVNLWRTNEQCLHLTVCDQGVGIPEDELESVFDNFRQSSKTQTSAGGTGLGLAICKEIVEAGHNGRIRASNCEGGGACFHVALPEDPRTRLAEG